MSKISLQVLATHTVDSSPSILLHFPNPNVSYLFNTPDSTSRVCLQSRIPMKKITHFFLDAVDSSRGLPGSLLGVYEGGRRVLQIVGPPGTDHLLASCRSFTKRDALSVKVTTSQDLNTAFETPVHSDTFLSVYAIPLPEQALSDPETVDSNVLKRSREGSPDQKHRKKICMSDVPSNVAWNFKSLTPSNLAGQQADEWRRMVINTMFQGKHFADSEPIPHHSRVSLLRALLPLPSVKENPITLSYVIRFPETRGKFLPEIAMELGVPKSKFSVLANGTRVWAPKAVEPIRDEELGLTGSESAKVVRKLRAQMERERELKRVDGEGEGVWVEPHQVLEPRVLGHSVLLLNIKSLDHIQSLLKIPEARYSTTSSPLTEVVYIVSFEDLVFSDAFQALVSLFLSTIKHTLLSPSNNFNPTTFVPSFLLSYRLSYLSDCFNIPQHSNKQLPSFPPALQDKNISLMTRPGPISQYFIPAQESSSEAAFDLVAGKELTAENRESKGLEVASDLRPGSVLEKAQDAWNMFYEKAKSIRQNPVEPEESKMGDNLFVTSLGTSSAIPSKYRNVSANLLHYKLPGNDEEIFILLDAGEGTLGQMNRIWGDDIDRVIKGLKIVFISHMHQDHHAGLATLLRKRVEIDCKDPLVIIGPPAVRTYIIEQHALYDLGLDKSDSIRFLHNSTMENSLNNLEEYIQRQATEALETAGLKGITPVPVFHRCRAWGVVIDGKEGWRVVYSGDTMPCHKLAKQGKGATLLIHEATIQDGLEELAKEKGHSTFGQAIEIGKSMQASNLYLTHFSGRYPKLPPLMHEKNNDMSVVMAFDFLTIGVKQFREAEKWKPALDSLLFWDEQEESTEEGNTLVEENID